MRQTGPEQKQFRDLLGKVESATLDEKDWKVLQTRSLDQLPKAEQDIFKKKQSQSALKELLV